MPRDVEARGGPRPAVGVSASKIESAPRPSKSDFFGAVQSGFPEKADNQGPGGTWGLALVHTGVDVDFQFVALVIYLWTLYAPGMRRRCVPHPRSSKWAMQNQLGENTDGRSLPPQPLALVAVSYTHLTLPTILLV